ncbi:sarcosine oxidase subunit gamma [Cognatishimia sp. MH4019]|uniref:sarcosine oxidase subunit gamma n=1 Tax=Cognatishimia sp. MH4019 TaxID=2854030 RepID=UPI001CD57A02|nr:sarcosine oxidase subunit gamma family protein [Cognatishimia sp. MH4019]
MSEAVTALNGAASDGYVRVEDAGLCGMISLRGDLSDAKVKKACKDVSGQGMPAVRGIAGGLDGGIGWMSPDEALILLPYAEAPAATARMEIALKTVHALVVEVSDARAVFTLRGEAVREVLAKVTPADIATLPVGELRRTRVAQVAGAVWLSDETTAHLICFRSVADYMFELLSRSAMPGSEVR